MEEKKGHAKITVDVEINQPLMDILRESMAKMPEMAKMFRERKE